MYKDAPIDDNPNQHYISRQHQLVKVYKEDLQNQNKSDALIEPTQLRLNSSSKQNYHMRNREPTLSVS
jgi:hypothetical protein